MALRKVSKQKAKLRIGMSGPSGSGKTYSALRMALGITTADKIAIIDTENGSADLYQGLGEYNVLPLEAPYTPEAYIRAITECEDAGMEVIIIDSVSHEWEGKGGLLELNEKIAQAKFKGNSWAAWSETTPRHQAFIQKITQSTCHIITTVRNKVEQVMGEDKKIKKVGTKEIQREGFEYELTLNFNLDREKHLAIASKDRTGIYIDADPEVITEETGKRLLAWAQDGADAPARKPITVESLEELVVEKGADKDKLLMYYGVDSLEELTEDQRRDCFRKLKLKV